MNDTREMQPLAFCGYGQYRALQTWSDSIGRDFITPQSWSEFSLLGGFKFTVVHS